MTRLPLPPFASSNHPMPRCGSMPTRGARRARRPRGGDRRRIARRGRRLRPVVARRRGRGARACIASASPSSRPARGANPGGPRRRSRHRTGPKRSPRAPLRSRTRQGARLLRASGRNAGLPARAGANAQRAGARARRTRSTARAAARRRGPGRLLERFDAQFAAASATDRATLFEAAAEAADAFAASRCCCSTCPIESAVEFSLARRLIENASQALVAGAVRRSRHPRSSRNPRRQAGGARARRQSDLTALRRNCSPAGSRPNACRRARCRYSRRPVKAASASKLPAGSCRRRAPGFASIALPSCCAARPTTSVCSKTPSIAPASRAGSSAALAGRIPVAGHFWPCSPARSSASRPSDSPNTCPSDRYRTARRPRAHPSPPCLQTMRSPALRASKRSRKSSRTTAQRRIE